MIHIVFGKSAEGSLRFALRGENHKVIGFPIDFSVGPITNIHNKSGIERYFSWFKSAYDTTWSGAEDDEIIYKQALQHLSEIKNDEQVIIWVCENASEQSGLRIIAHLLKDRDIELAIVNTYKAMCEYNKHKDIRIEIRHTGECIPEQLVHFLKSHFCPISKDMRERLERQREELIQNTYLARSWKEGEIIDELETKDDSFILECAEKLHHEMRNSEFMLVARLIGEVIGHSEQPLSDAWIEYRIRSLISSGYFQREGKSHMYKVKLV